VNPIGIVSMQFARPFGPEHFALLPRIKALGFDFLELLVPEKGEFELDLARDALQEAGLGVVLAARVNLQRNLAAADAGLRQAGVDYLKYAVDCAVALGSDIVGGPLYGNPLVYAGRAPTPVTEAERAARFQRCVDGLRAAAAYGAGTGVRLAVEPLNRFETDLLSTARQGMELMAALPPSVGLLLDSFHMAMEEGSMAEAIRLAGPRLIHFQANENHRGFPGSGSVPWPAVARALVEVGYAGPLSLEPFRRRDERFGISFAQWRPPQENEDDLLRASARFLRQQLLLAQSDRPKIS
jgi:D-psicose/D-tagatose/L-ribulose 3-epimerase